MSPTAIVTLSALNEVARSVLSVFLVISDIVTPLSTPFVWRQIKYGEVLVLVWRCTAKIT